MSLTGTWPAEADPADPFADEPFESLGWEDYRLAGGTLDTTTYAPLEVRFRELLALCRTGRSPDTTALVALAAQLLLDQAPRADRPARIDASTALPTHEDLARICTDLCPASTSEGLDRMLGPLADELDLTRPGHRTTALAALAAYCFVRQDGAIGADAQDPPHGRSAFDQWCRRKPMPTAQERADLRAVSRAPMGVWSLEAQESGRWRVVDQLGLAPHLVPDTPVRIPELGAAWRPARAGDTLVARIARGPDGWTAVCAFALPVAPPLRRIQSWLTMALWEGRLLDRALTVEDLQRHFPATLVRRVFEWAWLHGDEDPYKNAVLYDLEYADHTEDLDHYTALARRIGGPILELGCGTGRLSIAMARTGAEVDGVDLSQPMLDGLQRRLAKEDHQVGMRVRAWRSDFLALSSSQRYRLVVWPFNALHHCRSPEQVAQVLTRIRALLAPGGQLAIDCYLPAKDLYGSDPAEQIEPRSFTHPTSGELIRSWEQGWWDGTRSVHHVMYVYEYPDGRRDTTHLQLRMYELDALRTLFKQCGWALVSEAQDFHNKALTKRAMKWVGLLRPTS